ncbi:MAG: hypothetical protein AAF629_14645 [Chloroflexota bacterium]
MEKLRAAYRRHESADETAILQEIGNPSKDEIIDSALAGLKSENRNVRVLMLRVLAGQSGQKAMQGILLGLQDEKRRVKDVAIKSCHHFLAFPEITQRLEALAVDDQEHRKIRQGAIHCLTGHNAGISPLQELPEAAMSAIEMLVKNDTQRSEILFRLLFLDLNERVEMLLKDFVAHGSKEEAVMATRALCGYRVIHIVEFEGHPLLIKQVEQTCEVAAGRTYYWIKRDEFAELKEAWRQTNDDSVKVELH